MLLPILALGAISFVISWLATAGMIRIAPKLGFVDKPGGRKNHSNPKPLGGGVAMFVGFALPMLAGVAVVSSSEEPPDAVRRVTGHRESSGAASEATTLSPTTPSSDELIRAYWSGARKQRGLALALLGAMLIMHLLGLIDDRKALGPYVKLIVQLAVTVA